MFERFTDRARKIMALANQEAQRLNNDHIDTEHILFGFIKEGTGVGMHVLKSLNVDIKKLRTETDAYLKKSPVNIDNGVLRLKPETNPSQTPDAKKVIENAINEARALNHKYVGSEHILLGLMSDKNTVAGKILLSQQVSIEDVRGEIVIVLGSQ